MPHERASQCDRNLDTYEKKRESNIMLERDSKQLSLRYQCMILISRAMAIFATAHALKAVSFELATWRMIFHILYGRGVLA